MDRSLAVNDFFFDLVAELVDFFLRVAQTLYQGHQAHAVEIAPESSIKPLLDLDLWRREMRAQEATSGGFSNSGEASTSQRGPNLESVYIDISAESEHAAPESLGPFLKCRVLWSGTSPPRCPVHLGMFNESTRLQVSTVC